MIWSLAQKLVRCDKKDYLYRREQHRISLENERRTAPGTLLQRAGEGSAILLAQAQPNITISHAAYTLTTHLHISFALI